TIVNTCAVSTTSTAFPEQNVGNNTCVFTTVVVVPTPTPTVTPTTVPATPTPTPSPTVTPIPPVVIPQVIQNPARGGIFNGTRNDTPTPVRPREVGTAGSTGVGLPPAGVMPALRPPSTGDAGMPTLRMLRLNAW